MQLVIKSGPAAGHQYDLGGKPLTVGTDPASEIPLTDATIAGQHARFENIGGTIYVTDLASDKGTFLNGQRMSPAARYPLRASDLLQIGATFFQIEPAAPVAPAAEPVAATLTASERAALQPYQYQISKAYSPPPQVAQAPVQTTAQIGQPVVKKQRKNNWSAIIATVFVLLLLTGTIIYAINSSSSIEIKTTGQVTSRPTITIRATVTPVPPTPTSTPDQAGALFTGPTPGIGADKTVTPVQVSGGDMPVYPGARRIDNPGAGVYFTQYVTTDDFEKLSEWAKTAFADKGWTNIEVKALPGKEGAVLTGRKGSMSMVTYLLGPGQKDTAPYDNFFKSANVEPNGALVVINITA